MNWETLLCLGDSITIGSRSYLGYPEYCGSFLSAETNKDWNVTNHAVSGYTTIDLTRSIDKNFSNLKTIRPDIITILIGTNDLKSNTSPLLFKIAYEQLVVKAQLIMGNNNIILIGIPKLMDGVMLPYKTSMNQTVITYNEIIREISNTKGLIFEQLVCHKNDFYDGVHLNESGSKSFGNQICSSILKLRKN